MKHTFLLLSILFLTISYGQETADGQAPAKSQGTAEIVLTALKKTYNAWVLSTSFTVPMVRFDFIENENDRKGNISLFNSIGAGIGIHWGKLEQLIDKERPTDSDPLESEFYSTAGLQAGFLFSSGGTEENNNVFALTLSLSVLDFQIGYGYELGTIAENQKRGFITVAYSIPISKLIKKGNFIIKKTKEPNKDISRSNFSKL